MDFQAAAVGGAAQQLDRLVALAGGHQQAGHTLVDHALQVAFDLHGAQGGQRFFVLAGVDLGLGQLQRREVAIDAGRARFERLHCLGSVVELVLLKTDQGLLVFHVGRGQLAALILLVPLPAGNGTDRDGYATEDAGAILPQPAADAFTLFVLVEQIVDRHAYSRPAHREGPLGLIEGGETAPQCETGTTEPSEDT